MGGEPSLNSAPIFIGGCDRSGTTLLGSILGSHPACVVTPESPFKTEVIARLRGTGEGTGKAALEAIGSHWRFKIWGHPLPEGLSPGTYAEALSALVASYAVAHGRPPDARWVDHTPNNVRYAPTLLALFPDARFIHIVRDGRAVAASVIPLDWGTSTTYFAAPWWVERVAYGLAAESSLGPERVMRVRYEDLVTQPEATIRRVLAFAGLDPDPAVFGTPQGVRPTYTVQQHELIGSPVDPSRVNAYRSKLSGRDLEVFEWSTKEFLTLLGYEQEFGTRAAPPTRSERAAAMARELVARLRNRVRHARRRLSADAGDARG